MQHKVRGLEHAGFQMSLREIGNTYVLSKSNFPMTDAEYGFCAMYARRKMIWNSVFDSDPEFAHVYLGRLIGEVAVQSRMDLYFNDISTAMQDWDELEKQMEPVAIANEPLKTLLA